MQSRAKFQKLSSPDSAMCFAVPPEPSSLHPGKSLKLQYDATVGGFVNKPQVSRDVGQDHVVEILNRFGFDAQPVAIPNVENKKSPDVRLADGVDLFLIEVKKRGDPAGYAKSFWSKIEKSGEIVNFENLGASIPLSNAVRKRAEKSIRQIVDHADFCNCVHLAWVIADGIDKRGQFDQWRRVLYGIGYVIDKSARPLHPRGDSSPLDNFMSEIACVECDYFFDSIFHKLRLDLDGVVFELDEEIILMANDHSPRVDRLLASQFAKKAAKMLIHPKVRPGPYVPRYYADCLHDRRKRSATLKYLAQTYKLGKPELVDPMLYFAAVKL